MLSKGFEANRNGGRKKNAINSRINPDTKVPSSEFACKLLGEGNRCRL